MRMSDAIPSTRMLERLATNIFGLEEGPNMRKASQAFLLAVQNHPF